MKNSLHITASLDQPGLLESLVERLASRRYDIGFCREEMPVNWEALEVATTETYVSGTLSLTDVTNTEYLSVSFITPMLFTCIKGNDDAYRLRWSSSLS